MRGDEEIFLVHGFGLKRPGSVPLRPELLLHHKSVLHQLVRDNAADLFAGLALFSLGVWTRYQRTRPCWLLVVAPLNAPGSCSWRRAVCSMFSPPSFGFAMHANAGAFRTGFSLAARRSRKSTGFCIFRQMTLYEQLISVCPDYAKCTASRYISIAPYKNLYLFVQQKKAAQPAAFLIWA